MVLLHAESRPNILIYLSFSKNSIFNHPAVLLPACIFLAYVCLYWCKIITTGLIPHDWTTCLSVRKEGSRKALRHYFLRQTTMCLECPWLPRGFVPNTFQALLSGLSLALFAFGQPLDEERVCSELISSSTGHELTQLWSCF